MQERGFTLIELIAVMILVGIMSVALLSRMGGGNTAGVQAGRDSLIAACFFAQQTAMARTASDNEIELAVSGNTIDVRENGNSLVGYPLILSGGVTLVPGSLVYVYDKLGRIVEGEVGDIVIRHSSGAEARITLEASGYAYY